MLIIITILYLFFVQYSFSNYIGFREDCYKSFSIPEIFIKLLNYYTSGPLALSANFSYIRYSREPTIGPEIVSQYFYFAKYDMECKSSTIFTTGGSDFEKLFVNITLYHFTKDSKIADISYNFYRGFEGGEYELLDFNQNFAVLLKVLNTKRKYLKTPKISENNFIDYVNSIFGVNGDICIITENNRAAVVKLEKEQDLPKGYIIGIGAILQIKDSSKIGAWHRAFTCKQNEKYSDDIVIFIKDVDAMHESFEIQLVFEYKETGINSKSIKIKIINPYFKSVQELEQIPSLHIKIFLFYRFKIVRNCSNGLKATLYLSKDKREYYSTITKIIEISKNVEVYSNFQPIPQDSCQD